MYQIFSGIEREDMDFGHNRSASPNLWTAMKILIQREEEGVSLAPKRGHSLHWSTSAQKSRLPSPKK